ncbi:MULTISPECIES: nuclear transport factor 2 family protein [unclassified Mycobacterium]|uniref:nuclear transport factor 2 family protein n=1 Tax=unclassified Mycobacterium TaxID=2642494 RepID=UPI0029C8C5E4|nr:MULTISPECIES: nuclear transport factor 2 family protein [unclassified Mycobacterium]
MDEPTHIDELRREVRELRDRQAILDCIVREARGRDRHDSALIAGAFWPDGSDEHGSSVTPASEYADWANAGHAAFFSATSHNLTNHSCELVGDAAYCETYVIGGLLSKDGKRCQLVPSRYIDQLERRDGEWRILTRRTVIDMAAEGDASWLESRALRGMLKGLWNQDDPSYQRPVVAGSPAERW